MCQQNNKQVNNNTNLKTSASEIICLAARAISNSFQLALSSDLSTPSNEGLVSADLSQTDTASNPLLSLVPSEGPDWSEDAGRTQATIPSAPLLSLYTSAGLSLSSIPTSVLFKTRTDYRIQDLQEACSWADDDSADATSSISHTTSIFCGDNPGRYNHEVSQTDLISMSRKAAQFLGVESIARLPIIQYDHVIDGRSGSTRATDQKQGLPNASNAKQPGDSSWTEINSRTALDGTSGPPRAKDSSVCAICSMPFAPGDFVRLLPEQRCIHVGCIERLASMSHVEDSDDTPSSSGHEETQQVLPPPTDELDGNGNEQASLAGSSCSGIPSWTFVKIGDSLEGDRDEAVSSLDSIPQWSFAEVGEALESQVL